MNERGQDTVLIYASRGRQKTQRWYWQRKAANGRKLSRSTEGYRDRDHAVEMARRCNADLSVTETLANGQVRLSASEGTSVAVVGGLQA